MSKVNSTLFRRSGTLKMFFRLENTQGSLKGTNPAGPLDSDVSSAVGELVALDRRTAGAYGEGSTSTVPPAAVMAASAALEKPCAVHAHRAGELAPAQHLDEGALVGQAVRVEVAPA